MERASLLLGIALLAVTSPQPSQNPINAPRPVLVQGAMPSETELLVGRLDGASVDRIGGWTFWRGTMDGYPVIVSKTLKGMSNAAAATALAIERYQPIAIINQGTAGGHIPTLRVYDIVLGTSAVNLGAFKSPRRPAGQGSNTLRLDAARLDGVGGQRQQRSQRAPDRAIPGGSRATGCGAERERHTRAGGSSKA